LTVKVLFDGAFGFSTSLKMITSEVPSTVAPDRRACAVGLVLSTLAPVVPEPESDQPLSPSSFFARTCTR
jgi:hypothetical protein